MYEYFPNVVSNFPIVIPGVKQYDNMINLVKEILLNGESADLAKQVDILAYAIYGLDEKDISFIENDK